MKTIIPVTLKIYFMSIHKLTHDKSNENCDFINLII